MRRPCSSCERSSSSSKPSATPTASTFRIGAWRRKPEEENPMESDAEKSDPGSSRTEELAALIAEFSDRVNAGELSGEEETLPEHPEVGARRREARGALQQVNSGVAPQRPLKGVGDFRISRGVGRGGMGIVHEAWQISMERPVA